MRLLEWIKRLFRPKGRLGGPAGGPHPGPFPTAKKDPDES